MEEEPDGPVPSASSSEEMTKKDHLFECSAAQRNNNDNIQESDGSFTNFDSVVKRMNEDVLVEYLHDILSFLLSDRQQLRINTSGLSELFLANLFRCSDNLTCKYFNKRCANMAKQVIKVLDNNSDIYNCQTLCEKIGNKKWVVYRKERSSKCRVSSEEDTCCSSSNPQSITENLHSDCPNHQNHKVPQDFKSRWLKTTLRFIKDESKTVYKYPEMSPMEATFVYSIITRCKDQTEISPNSYFMPLKEAMQIFGLKYFFELTYINTDRNGRMSLMLEKIPKNIKSIIEGDRRCSNRFRNLKFIKQPKTRTSDENRATRVVSRLKNQERYKSDAGRPSEPPSAMELERRLKENPGINPELHVYYAPTLDRLNQLAPKRSRQNQIMETSSTESVVSSRNGRRDRSCSEKRTDKLLKDMSVPIKSDKAMKMMYGMGWDGGALGARGNGITEPIIPTLDLKSGAGLGHTTSPKKEPRNRYKQKSGTGFAPTPSPKNQLKTNYQQPSETGFSKETFNKKEPIVNDQQHSGVNLARTPLIPQEPPNTTEIIKAQHQNDRRMHRLEMLQFFLNMITSDDIEREIKFDRRLTKKEKGFINHVLRCANGRNNVVFSDSEDIQLWSSIFKTMTDNPDMHIKINLTDDCKRLTLTKDFSPQIKKIPKRYKRGVIANIPPLEPGEKKIITNDFMRHLTDTYVSIYANNRVSTKAETGVTFRVVILIHILDIVISDRMETVLEFERVLNDKEKDYVENTVVTIGTRKKRGGSMLEQDLLKEIKENLRGYLLRKQFFDDRTFVVRKIVNKSQEKTLQDISYATCSTDDNDKNYLTSRCSDDTDAGHDDSFDNDCDDENNVNNDNSKVSKDLNVNDIRIQESVSTVLNGKDDAIILSDTMDFDKNIEEIEATELDDDDKPEDIKSAEFQINVGDYGNGTTTCNNISKLVSEDALKELKCDTSNTNVDDLEQDTEFLVLETNDNLEKDSTSDMETDIPDVQNTSRIEINNETDMQNFDKMTASNLNADMHDQGNGNGIDVEAVKPNLDNIAIINALKANGKEKNSVFDVLKSYVENFNKNPEMRFLQSIERNEQITVSDISDRNVTKIKNEAENNITSHANKQCTEKENLHLKLSDVKGDEVIPQVPETAKKSEHTNTKLNEVKYVKRVYLMPWEYPVIEADTDFARIIQIMISKEIDVSTELPLLKCHGVQDGSLIYSCHSESTLQWLERVCVANNIRIVIPIKDEVRYKMSLKINSFIDYTSRKLFKMLQLYNKGLATDNWIELSVEKSCDSLTFIVDLDDKSLKYIKDSNFSLFAGIDQVQFSPVLN